MALLLLFSLALTHGAIPDIWKSLPPMKTRRSDSVAVQSNGIIYIGGGCINNQTINGSCTGITEAFECYDINKQVWSDLKPLPRPRYRYSAAVVDGKIYYVHGRDLAENTIPDVDVYDISKDSWTQLPLQLEGLLNVSDSAAFVLGTKIYVTGGYDVNYTALTSTVVLDTADGTGKFKSGVVANKSIASGDLGANTLNGKGYVFGGFSELDWNTPLNSLEQYDPASNTWKVLNPFLHRRGDMGSAVVGKFLFVIGGEDKNRSADNVSYPVADVEQWDSTTGEWAERTSISESRFRFTSTSYNTWIFNLGGQENAVSDPNGGTPYYPIDNHVTALDTGNTAHPIAAATASLSSLLILLVVTLFYF